MARKHKMPQTRKEFEDEIKYAFLAGCEHGYGVEHGENVCEQEQLGAEHWLGNISDEEFYRKWDELKGY